MPLPPARALLCCALLSPLCAQSSAELDQLVPESAAATRPTVAFGDLDGDRVVDLVIGRNGPLSWRAGRSGQGDAFGDERALGCTVGVSCESPGQPVLADFDRDGDLDLMAIDLIPGPRERLVWFANDGKAGFAAAAEVRLANGQPLQWTGQASGLAVVDDDGDGWVDVWIASPSLRRFAGGPAGLANTRAMVEVSSDAGLVVVRPGNDRPCRLLVVQQRRLVVLQRDGDRFVPVEDLGPLEGDAGQTRLALDRAGPEGSQQVLVLEYLPRRQQPATMTPQQQ